ncbi:MAG: helix-turn-helix transcriptional regulator [Pseudomonadota bacterium]
MSENEMATATQQAQAEAALELLKSLASAGEDTDTFTKACSDWARLSGDASSLPEFQSVIEQLSRKPVMEANPARENDIVRFKAQNLLRLDAHGLITDLSRDLADFMHLKKGDLIDASNSPSDVALSPSVGAVVEKTDRFGINRRLKLIPIYEHHKLVGYSAYIGLFWVSDQLSEHLRCKFDLTASEIEILALTLRRLNLRHIADYRGVALSTVRTHVARAINKLHCHSLTEAAATILELSDVVDREVETIERSQSSAVHVARRITLQSSRDTIEYRRFGPSNGHPVIILHSLEYGYLPSPSMIEVARRRHINLIFPIRPGFGDTVATRSEVASARTIVDFLTAIDVSAATIVGVSTAAPLALFAGQKSKRIERVVLVNYGLNVADKLSKIEPNWVRGLLRMALNSAASFRVGLAAMRSIVRSYGGQRFYQRLYRGQSADERYLEDSLSEFALFSNYLLSADPESVRQDIVSAFLPNKNAETSLIESTNVRVINGSNQHGVGVTESKQDAERLGVEFAEARFEGRNWLFRHPKEFFDLALD